jgi:PAS domain S-box-containing protein
MTTKNSFDTLSVAAFHSDEESCRLILNNVEDTYVLVNTRLQIIFCNQAARDGVRNLMGLEVYTHMNVLELSSPDRRQKVQQLYEAVLRGERHETETRFQRADGSLVFFRNILLPAYDAGKKVVGLIVTAKNITEEKKAQQAIQDSEERLQFALEAAHQGVWDWNLETNEVIYSASYKKLYGFEDVDLKNDISEWITRIHPDDQKKMQNSVDEHLQSQNPVYDTRYRILDKDGSYRWVMAKGRLLRRDETGKPLRMIGTHTDITESIEREEALRQMNERFDSMMKATHELLWEWDITSDQITRSKDSLKKVYGIQNDSSIKKIEDWLQHIHPDDRTLVRTVLNKVLKAPNQYTFELEYRFRRDDGEYAHIYDRGILLKDEKDNPVRIIGSAEDISERKRLEKELLRNELEYQRLIHQATIDSQEKERAEIGKELHDNINQVLTTTKLYLDLALTNSAMKDELMQRSLNNINTVINEIRHLSRSLMDPSIDDLGLVDSINDLVENIHLTQKLNVVHSIDCAVDCLLDTNQKLAIFRIIQESLNNVLRHAKATTVWLLISIKDGQLHLTLKDDGVGFDPNTARKGAGLKNIQNRIYLINGSLQIDSKPQQGCTIVLQFPVRITN